MSRQRRSCGRVASVALFASTLGVMTLQLNPHATAQQVARPHQPSNLTALRGIGSHDLNDVVALRGDLAIAVGLRAKRTFTDEAVIRLWNGDSWVRAEAAQPYNSELLGVDGSSPDDVWAVGDQNYQLLTQHWNGSKWAADVLPPPDG